MSARTLATPMRASLKPFVASVLVFSTLFAFGVRSARAATCESLATLALPDTTITLAEAEAAGKFTPPKPGNLPGPPLDNLPAFCRVAVEVKPTKDPDIKFELWMPASEWNGKFMGLGNGGWAGEISHSGIGDALRRAMPLLLPIPDTKAAVGMPALRSAIPKR